MPCEPRTPRAGKPETSPGKVCVRSERPRTRARGGWACGPRAEASCPWAPGGARAGDGGGGPAVGLTGGWHASGQRGGRLRNMRRRPPRAPPPAACLSTGQAKPTRGPHPAQDGACTPRGRPLPPPLQAPQLPLAILGLTVLSALSLFGSQPYSAWEALVRSVGRTLWGECNDTTWGRGWRVLSQAKHKLRVWG